MVVVTQAKYVVATPASGGARDRRARRELAEVSGPYTFDGRYLVRFEQYAPEDANLDVSAQTPFTAALQRREGDPTGGKELFAEAKRSGRRERTIHGRYLVEVSFGDFPYVIRFTPRG